MSEKDHESQGSALCGSQNVAAPGGAPPIPVQTAISEGEGQQPFQLPSERFVQERSSTEGIPTASVPLEPIPGAPVQGVSSAGSSSGQAKRVYRRICLLIISAISLFIISVIVVGVVAVAVIDEMRRGPVDAYNDAVAQMIECLREGDAEKGVEATLVAFRLRMEYSDEIEAAIEAGDAEDVYDLDVEKMTSDDPDEDVTEDDAKGQ